MQKQYNWEHGPIINGGESIPVVHYMGRKEIIEIINDGKSNSLYAICAERKS